MSEVMMARRGDAKLDETTLRKMYRLRHQVFHERLGWDVHSDDGMEHDEFDEVGPVYVLVRGDDAEVEACWRLLPTQGPYMLKDTFPELLAGKPAPARADVWELSRFAVAEGRSDPHGFGLSHVPLRMLAAALRFARQNGIGRYVSVTSVAIERMFRKLGIEVERLGPPLRIGRVLTVACAMDVDDATEHAVYAALPVAPERRAA